jgi:hypothetical protein
MRRLGKALIMSPEVAQLSRSSNQIIDVSLDTAGQTILRMLHKAADVAEQNSRQAIGTAQQLSQQLRAAEQRIADLEAESHIYQCKSAGVRGPIGVLNV